MIIRTLNPSDSKNSNISPLEYVCPKKNFRGSYGPHFEKYISFLGRSNLGNQFDLDRHRRWFNRDTRHQETGV